MESPCIDACTLDDLDRCLGCERTLAEIAGWSGLSPDTRRAITTDLERRRAERPV